MSAFELAALILVPALVPCIAVAALGRPGDGLAAVEVGGMIATSVLIALAEAYHRQPFIDLAIVLGLLSAVGALVFARLMERRG